MDLENYYFLIKLQSEEDYVKALTEGLWLVEYESLRNVCFTCGHYGHMKESDYKPSERGHSDEDIGVSTSNMQPQVQGENHDVTEKYGSWMLVDQCPRKSD
ncbi:reverse transcriptase [Gossypium australe]|uniref:Reverse transcriptase n=1 Tax=Gossypium australe TaxID=47621 RepID=A0A5B6WFU6_9ROSI|nr:reverse transcriptase [Gossypium australe]